MEKEDKYWIFESEYTLRYFKNGQYHREAGPSFFLKTDKNFNDYINLDDDDLYKDKRKQTKKMQNIETLYLNSSGNEHEELYYLEGIQYSKAEFYVIKTQKELEQELTLNKINIKKAKI